MVAATLVATTAQTATDETGGYLLSRQHVWQVPQCGQAGDGD
jgi:hypothetical protein